MLAQKNKSFLYSDHNVPLLAEVFYPKGIVMNRSVFSAALAVSVLAAGAAFAGEQGPYGPFYMGARAGVSFQKIDNLENALGDATVSKDNESNAVGVFGVALGYDFQQLGAPIRAEIEYSYRSDFDYDADPLFSNAAVTTSATSNLNSHTVMLNAYYDIDTGTRFTPYVGGGLGVAINRTKATASALGQSASGSKTKTNLAWSLAAGVGYAFDANWVAELGYRYIDLGKAAYGDSDISILTSDNVTAHEVLAGLRYRF